MGSLTKILLFIILKKKDLNIYSLNRLYHILNNVNGYFEEINGNRYLMLVPINKSKEKRKNV